jgi:hypothetical protein
LVEISIEIETYVKFSSKVIILCTTIEIICMVKLEIN